MRQLSRSPQVLADQQKNMQEELQKRSEGTPQEPEQSVKQSSLKFSCQRRRSAEELKRSGVHQGSTESAPCNPTEEVQPYLTRNR